MKQKMESESKIEFRNLEQENNQITTSINTIMISKGFNQKEKDELWALIMKLTDNEIEQEDCCNK